MAGNIYDDALSALDDEQQQGPQQDPFEEAASRLHDGREARLRASMLEREKVDPERAADAMRLSRETGLPARLVEQNYDRVRREAENGRTPYEAMFAETPALAEWATDPLNAQVAADDMEQLGALEWLVSAPGRAFSQGINQVRFAQLRHESLFRELTRAEQDQLESYRFHMTDGAALGAGSSWFRKAVTGGAQQLPNLFGASLYAGAYGLAGAATTAAGGAAVGAAAGGVGAIPGALAAAPYGARAGGLYGAAKFGFVIESGLALDEFLAFKDETGQTIDPAVARVAALSAGAMAAGFEAVGFEALARTIPGLDKLTSVGARAAVKRALRQPSVRAALAEAARAYGTTLATETATEVAQRGITIMAGELAKAATDPAIQTRTTGDIAEDLLNEGIGAVEGFAFLAGAGPAMGAARAQRQIQQGEQTAAFFKALGGQASASATMKRAPEAVQALLERATKDGPIGTIYAPAESWVQYWQSQGVDPAEIAKDVIGSSEALERALATGEDLAIPTARYAVTLAATEHNRFFAEEMRLAPGEMNAREAREFKAQLEAEAAAEQQAAVDAELTPAQQVRAAVLEQLTGAGVERSTAESYADLYESTFGSLAERAGVDPRDMLAEIGLTVDRPALETARPRAGGTPAEAGAAPGAGTGPTSGAEPRALPLDPNAETPGFGDEVPGMAALEAASAGATIEPIAGEGAQGPGLEVNASGESGASFEAMSRLEGMKARGEQFGYFDRAGRFTPVIGADAVDFQPRKGQTFGVAGPDGFRVLTDNGGRIVDRNLPAREDGGGDAGRSGEAQAASAGRDAGEAGAQARGEGSGGAADVPAAEPLEPYANPERLGIYADALDAARSLDPQLDEAKFRAEFDYRLDIFDEMRGLQQEESPVVLLREIAKRGGIYEDERGQAGEMRRLREGAAFGKVGGVPGVLSVKKRQLVNVKKKIDGKIEIRQERRGGLGLDVMLQDLQAEGRWPWLEDIEDLVEFINDVQINGIPEALGAVPNTADLKGLGIDFSRDWWNDVDRQAVDLLDVDAMESDILEPDSGAVDTSFNVADFSQSLFDQLEEPGPGEQLTAVDVLDTGEEQARLPGDVGAVREEERPTPKMSDIEDEFRLTSEVENRKGFQTTLFQPYNPVDSPAFRRWFGNSLAVDGSGNPMRLFHGTAATFDAFDPRLPIYLTNLEDEAVAWGETRLKPLEQLQPGDPEEPIVMPLYARIENPVVVETWDEFIGWDMRRVEQLEAEGYDGAVFRGENDGRVETMFIAFRPTQVKHADENSGAFDRTDPVIYNQPDLEAPATEFDAEYPVAGATVSGFTVRNDVPNTSSIAASLSNYEVLPGIREVQTAERGREIVVPSFYSTTEETRTRDLARALNESKEINPLIVVIDKGGLYILEGAHRFDALALLRVPSFPALVVIDRESLPKVDDRPFLERTFKEQFDAVEAFTASMLEREPELLDFSMTLDPRREGVAILQTLSVRRGAARQGLGSKVMRELSRWADRNGVRLELSVAGKGYQPTAGSAVTTSGERLYRFYSRFGFVRNRGRRKDFTTTLGMYREPTVYPDGPVQPTRSPGPSREQLRAFRAGERGVREFDQPLYHGSPHDFEEFSTSAIGTGEGAAAYGWGLYFAEDPAIAGHYFDTLSGEPQILEMKLGTMRLTEANSFDYSRRASESDVENVRATLAENLLANPLELLGRGPDGFQSYVLEWLDQHAKDLAIEEWAEGVEATKQLRAELAKPGAASIKWEPKRGGVYTVEVDDAVVEKMLDWDAPIDKQPKAVQDLVREGLKRRGYLGPKDNGPRQLKSAFKAYTVERGSMSQAPNGEMAYRIIQGDEEERIRKPLRERAEELRQKHPAAAVGGGIGGVPEERLRAQFGEDYDEFVQLAVLEERAAEDAARLASLKLKAAGVPGLKYEDANSRDAGKRRKLRNMVLFDDKLVVITHKNGTPVTPKERREFIEAVTAQTNEAHGLTARDIALRRWFGASQIVDEDGEPLVVYHGTTGIIDTFDITRANVESDLGAGFYFSSSAADVGFNYASDKGPDLVQKLELAAERLGQEYDSDENVRAEVEQWIVDHPKELRAYHRQTGEGLTDPVAAIALMVRERLGVQHGGLTMPVYLKMEKPARLGGRGESLLDYTRVYDEPITAFDPADVEELRGEGLSDEQIVEELSDREGYEPTEGGAVIEFLEALRNGVDGANDVEWNDLGETVSEIVDRARDRDGIPLREAIDMLLKNEQLGYASNDEGTLIRGEIIRAAIEALGYDGIIDTTVDTKFGSQKKQGTPMAGMNADTVHYIVFKAEQVKSAVGNVGTFDPNDPRILYQKEERGRRGAIRFGPGRQVSISLFERADLSTFLHESGHLFLELMGDLVDKVKATDPAQRTAQQQALIADYATLLEWFEVDGRAGIGVDQHEKFAAAFEVYLGEGKAPSLRLQSAFSRFRAWILGVYRSLSRLGVQFTPEVRAVVDRMVAGDIAIAQANDLRNAPPMFTTAESAGMTPEEFALYESTIQAANRTAREQLDRRLMAEVQREQTKQWKDRRNEIEAEVAAEVYAEPVYRALAAMQRGTNPDGSPMVEGLETEPLRLSRAILVARYGLDYLKRLPRPYIYAADGGLDPNFVASMFGFDSGDALLKAVEDAAPARDVIKARTEQRMLAEHGSLLLDGTLQDAALAAISNEDRDAIVRAELRALAKLRATVRPFEQAAGRQLAAERRERDYERRFLEAETKLRVAIAEGAKQLEIDQLRAELSELRRKARGGARVINAALPKHEDVVAAAKARIAGMRVRQIRPDVFWHASRRAAQQALERAARQDYDGAIESKRKELLNLALYREAQRVLEDVEARVKFARGLARPATRSSIGLAGHNYLDQIDGILDRFEFARVSQKALDRRASLIKFIEGLESQGLPTDMPEELLNEALRTNYQNLTVEQLVGVTDGLKALVHLARLKNRLLKKQAQAELDATADTIAASIRDNFKGTPASAGESDRRPSTERLRAVQDFIASHRKIASIVREMDGFADGGPLWEAVVRPLNDAGAREAEMNAQAAQRFQALVDAAFPTARDKRALYEKEIVPSVGRSLSKMERIGIALNWGNEGNRDRIRRSEGWTDEQVAGILATLTEADFKFVQGVLDLINGYWSDIAAKQERVYGVAPEKVEATPIRTAFGEFAGGYFPLKYDERRSAKAGAFVDVEEAGLARAAAYAQSTTKRGHTKARVDGVKLPVRRDFGVMFEHVRQVIHDLSHHEALIDVGRVLAHPTVQAAIYETHGDVVYRQLKNGVRDIAIGDVPATTAFERAINHLRQGATIAGLGWNVTTALLQPLGLTQSMVRIGPKWVARGMARWLRDAASMENTAAWVRERSTFMRERGRTQQREINEIRNAVGVNTGKFSGWIDDVLKGVTGGKATRQGVADSYFFLIQQAQLIADLPTWLGQYEKALENGVDEATAVAQADQAVLDSQGGGQVKDLAGIQRGGPLLRLWTNFYSFFNVTYNLAAESTRRTNFRKPGDIGRLMVDYLLLYSVPALLGYVLREAIKPNGDDDEDENLGLELVREQAAYILGTMVITREIAGVVGGGYGYEGPAGARAFSSASRLIQQAEQGEPDAAFWRSLNDTAGAVFHYPAGQVKRTVEGFAALLEGKTSNPGALISGAPK